MKIVAWADSPTVDTGFGVVSKNLFTRWQKAGHEVVVLGVNEYGDNPRSLDYEGVVVYPTNRGGPEEVYGIRKFWPIVAAEKPDVLFLLNDPWLIQSMLAIKPPELPDIKTVAYYPTDGAPMKPSWLEVLNTLEAQVCYSKYAEKVVTTSNGGVRPDNLYQIYHGVDTRTFFPFSQQQARLELGLPLDTFIVGMVARNQPRKRFDILAMAFAQFAKDKDNVKIYFHTGLHDVGFDIIDLARQLKIEDKLILSEDITPVSGVSPQRLNLIYNSFDVHSLISLGDGFGLPVAESMATGCPQIVSGHSCLQELVEGHGGLTVKNVQYLMNASGFNTWGGLSDVTDLVDKLEFMYTHKEARVKMGEEGFTFILQPQFHWDNAAKDFMKIFNKIHHIYDVDGGRKEKE